MTMASVLCPVCLESGREIPMIKGRPTTFYWYYRCPECGNLALVERRSPSEL
jgi:ssDNA-binding Zn-finger/Zn-ribbon topoisomerase 1